MTAARLLLGLILLAAAAAPARAGAYDKVDEALERVGEQLSKIEAPRLAGRYASEADCLKRFDLDALIRDATSGAMIDDLAWQMDGVVQQSFRYYTCAAAARGDDAACAPLAAFDDYARPHPRLECQRYSKELVYIRALMTGAPNLHALCRASLTHPEDVEFRPEDFDAACSIMLADYRRPAAACGRLLPYFVKPAQLEKCEAWFASFSGDVAGCRQLGDNDVRERCFSYAYFSRARATGDVKDCRGSGICEMFMGGGEAGCAYYTRRIAANLCRYQSGRNGGLARKRAGLKAEVASVEAALKALPPGPGTDARCKNLEFARSRLEKHR